MFKRGSIRRTDGRSFVKWACLMGAALFLAACASGGQPPVEQLSNVEMTIARARQNEADKYAPLDLRLAEEKLAEARRAVAEENYDKARRKADEALADARLAEARAQSERARKLSVEMEQSIDTLRREIDRKQ